MRIPAALVWPVVPCVGLSAIVHSTDQASGELAALLVSPAWLLSSLVWSLPLLLAAYGAVLVHTRHGPVAGLAVLMPCAAGIGGVIAALGSTASSALGVLWSATGAGAVTFIVLALASVPAARVLVGPDRP